MIVQEMNSNLPLFEAKPELGKWHLILQPNLPFCPGMTEKDSTSNSHLHKGAVTTVNQREGTHPVSKTVLLFKSSLPLSPTVKGVRKDRRPWHLSHS